MLSQLYSPTKITQNRLREKCYNTSVRDDSDLARDVAQWKEYLLSIQDALGLIPSTTKTRYGTHL